MQRAGCSPSTQLQLQLSTAVLDTSDLLTVQCRLQPADCQDAAGHRPAQPQGLLQQVRLGQPVQAMSVPRVRLQSALMTVDSYLRLITVPPLGLK